MFALPAWLGTLLALRLAVRAIPVIGIGAQNVRTSMGEISDTQMMTALRRSLSLAAAKQVVSASNLANLNTPGYKAREVDFASALDAQVGAGGMKVTNARHLAGTDTAAGATTRETADAARRDGNTVQVDRELLNMTRAAGEFSRAQTALAAKFRLVRYAINESR